MKSLFSSVLSPALLGLSLLVTPGCRKAPPAVVTISGPMVQRAYVWQREWTRQVSESVAAHSEAFDEMAVLAAQVEWRAPAQPPSIVKPAIDWAALKSTGKSIGLVVRVHRAGDGDRVSETVAAILQERLAEARAAGVAMAEFQIDYDCPQKSLEAYVKWLAKVREALRPTAVPLRITSLPSWLGEPRFVELADVTDGYVLQVHSFDLTTVGKAPTVCDPVQARDWVAQAAKLGRPFYVALPTYRCVAGYAPDGHLLGMAADAGTPNWPKGTRILELTSDAEAISALVAGWTKERPAIMQGVFWYRLPIEGETRNWRWSTLAAVMTGRPMASKWEVRTTAGNPVDFTLWNAGEKDEPLPREVRITWPGAERIAAADALGGWTCEPEPERIIYRYPSGGPPRRIPPGGSVSLGWMRFHETPEKDIPFSHDIIR